MGLNANSAVGYLGLMSDSTPPISVQLYSLREQAKTDFVDVLTRVGAMGFVGVELAGLNGLTTAQFSKVIADAGLVVSSGHVGNLTTDALHAALDELQEVGCNRAVAAFLPPTTFEDLDAIKHGADVLNAANARAASRGMRFGYHNHWWEFETMVDDKRAWDHLIDMLDPGLFIELDLYWAKVGGADPIQVIGKLGDRLKYLHVKDGPADDPDKPMVAVGSGSIDIKSVLNAATVDWHVVELDRCETDMFEAIELSHKYLTSNGLSRGRS
jgi:sugar phosphate isomerase/epimerase